MPKLAAIPYTPSKPPFYFTSYEEWLKKEAVHPSEEFEIKFISEIEQGEYAFSQRVKPSSDRLALWMNECKKFIKLSDEARALVEWEMHGGAKFDIDRDYEALGFGVYVGTAEDYAHEEAADKVVGGHPL